ncbi:MAG: S1 RNA-binding domain-containing protein [Planctomycetota bacterium]
MKVGDVVKVKVIDVDEGTGKIRLSRRAVMAEEKTAPVEA